MAKIYLRVFNLLMGLLLVGVCLDIGLDKAPVSLWVKLPFIVMELLLAACCFWMALTT